MSEGSEWAMYWYKLYQRQFNTHKGYVMEMEDLLKRVLEYVPDELQEEVREWIDDEDE